MILRREAIVDGNHLIGERLRSGRQSLDVLRDGQRFVQVEIAEAGQETDTIIAAAAQQATIVRSQSP